MCFPPSSLEKLTTFFSMPPPAGECRVCLWQAWGVLGKGMGRIIQSPENSQEASPLSSACPEAAGHMVACQVQVSRVGPEGDGLATEGDIVSCCVQRVENRQNMCWPAGLAVLPS